MGVTLDISNEGHNTDRGCLRTAVQTGNLSSVPSSKYLYSTLN